LFSGFRRDDDETCTLLGHYATCFDFYGIMESQKVDFHLKSPKIYFIRILLALIIEDQKISDNKLVKPTCVLLMEKLPIILGPLSSLHKNAGRITVRDYCVPSFLFRENVTLPTGLPVS
jgi:hypothetical protein